MIKQIHRKIIFINLYINIDKKFIFNFLNPGQHQVALLVWNKKQHNGKIFIRMENAMSFKD